MSQITINYHCLNCKRGIRRTPKNIKNNRGKFCTQFCRSEYFEAKIEAQRKQMPEVFSV